MSGALTQNFTSGLQHRNTHVALAPAPQFLLNIPQRGDALELLQSLADNSVAVAHFDPQHRTTLDKLAFGNEGQRQRARCELPQMSDGFIRECEREIARVLRPSGYYLCWVDAVRLCEGHHHHLAECAVTPVDLIAWNSLKQGMGKRSRRYGGYLLILQKAPKRAEATWSDHGISDRWTEKVNRRVHPHLKPRELLRRILATITKQPDDRVIDPAAGSFLLLDICQELNRHFIGCDIAWREPGEGGAR